jgi:hypothetical protein
MFTAPRTAAGERILALRGAIDGAPSDHPDADVAPEPDAPIVTRLSGLPLRRSDLSNAWKDACAVVGLRGVHPTTSATTQGR